MLEEEEVDLQMSTSPVALSVWQLLKWNLVLRYGYILNKKTKKHKKHKKHQNRKILQHAFMRLSNSIMTDWKSWKLVNDILELGIQGISASWSMTLVTSGDSASV